MTAAGGDHLCGFIDGARQRLFAQHMLTGGGRLERELGMLVVGQRNVDGVNVRIADQRLV